LSQKSSFLSVTCIRDKAEKRCETLKSQGFQNVELLEINSNGPAWEHTIQRVWRAEDIIKSFSLTWHAYHLVEYLVEQSIPAECVERYEW
jgi:hypothetical protein